MKEPLKYQAIIITALDLACRRGELTGLTWDDIDLNNKTISVNKITVKRNHGVEPRRVTKVKGTKQEHSDWYFGTPKTSTSTRIVHIGDTLCSALKRAKANQRKNELQYGEFYTKIYKQTVTDEKGEPITKLIEVEKSIPVNLPVVDLICVREDGHMVTTDSFKYCSNKSQKFSSCLYIIIKQIKSQTNVRVLFVKIICFFN